MQAIFTKVRSLNTTAPIILYNIYNPFAEIVIIAKANDAITAAAGGPSFYAFLHTIGEQIATGVNSNVIEPFANVLPGTYIADAYSAFDGKQEDYIIPGDIHPNVNGQMALAGLATFIIGTFPPKEVTVELIPTPTEETTGPVIIEVSTSEEVPLMKWLPGLKEVEDFANDAGTIITDNKFEVTENGTYTVYTLDQREVEKVTSITIENIKEKPPVVEPPVEKPDPEPTKPEPKPTTPKPTPTTPGTGNPLPNTASPVYNYLAIGSALVLAGFVAMIVQNRRRKEI